jgi:hypothetical protein
MARWPNVPAVYGWMSLDRRGRWCLRGQPVTHHGTIEFMNRNYACAAGGRWYFQNGPQRAYVDLDYTPWVFRLDGSDNLVDHVGSPVTGLREAWIDEEGNLLLLGDRGIGLLCDRDLEPVSERLRHADGAPCDEGGVARLVGPSAEGQSECVYLAWHDARIEVGALRRGDVPGKFGFEPRPRVDDDRDHDAD